MKCRLIVVALLVTGGAAASEAAVEGDVSAALTPEAIESRIRQCRMGELIVKTTPGAEVSVEQVEHAFWFGTAISNSMARGRWRRRMRDADLEKYQATLAANFNAAVHENALKWHHCERTRTGGSNYSVAEEIYRWCAGHQIPMRGHCIFWAGDRHVQGWVKQLDDDALRAVVERRARDVTSRFKGRIEEFDLNNEMIHGAFYRRRLGKGITKQMAQWAKKGNPAAALYLNDYAVLSGGGRNAEKYVAQIRAFLRDGVPIDGIGCQGHFRHMVDPQHVQRTLDRLAAFKLPIKITEYDFDSRDEQLKAEHLRRFYEVCFAHPAVEGILMWGFWAGAHWKPQAALWKRDWSETPAAAAYRDLVYRRWWTRAQGTADDAGVYRVRAFYGKHTVTCGGKKQTVTVRKNEGQATVVFGQRAAVSPGKKNPLTFASLESGGYRFDTGVVKGLLREGGRSVGLTSVVHSPTGVTLCKGHGLVGHYRVFANGKRYGHGAWDWPSTSALNPDGSVTVTWPATETRLFALRAMYRWKSPAVLEVVTTVTARSELKGFEAFLASYLGTTFSRSFGSVQELPAPAHGPGFLEATRAAGHWQMFPRNEEAVGVIQDGRWKLPPNPVDWVIRPRYGLPVGIRRDPASKLVVAVMASAQDCFAVAMPFGADGHHSIYLSLFGRDIRAGGTATARAMIFFGQNLGDRELLARCKELLETSSR